MKTSNRSKFVAAAVLFICCGSLPARAAVRLNFKLLHGYLIVIPVTVNGAGPVEFLLDTGSSTTLLTPEFARQLRLRPLGRIELVTVAGAQVLVRSQVETLTLGSHAAGEVEVLVSELREVRAAAPQVCGVLGQNFLAQFNYMIDYRARQLVFEEATELETSLAGERLRFEAHEGRWLVTAPARQRTWRFVPDSAIVMPLFFRNAELNLDPVEPAAWQARTDLGLRTVQQRRLRCFELGGTRFFDLSVIVLPAEQAGADRIEDGLLPTSLCQRIYFNHQKGYVILNPVA